MSHRDRDEDSDLITPKQTTPDFDGEPHKDAFALGEKFATALNEEHLEVPQKLNICQWVLIVLLYLIFAFLVGFIIYISATWNKDRTNEYT